MIKKIILMLLLCGISLSAEFRKCPYLIFDLSQPSLPKPAILWQTADKAQSVLLQWSTNRSLMKTAVPQEYGEHQFRVIFSNLPSNKRIYYKVTADNDIYSSSFFSPPDSHQSNLTFFVYGDTRSKPWVQNKVLGQILKDIKSDPSSQTFLLHDGDFVENGDDEYQWDDQFFGKYDTNVRRVLASLPLMGTKGNHEKSGNLELKYFPYCSSFYYYFDYGPVRIFSLDTEEDLSKSSKQYKWFSKHLKETKQPWKIVLLHKPGWSAGGHENNKDVQKYIQPLLRKYHVPLLFAGHNHYYARAEVKGVSHITTGGGGAPLYDPSPDYPYIVQTAKKNHFCKIRIRDSFLDVQVISDRGIIIDQFQKKLKK